MNDVLDQVTAWIERGDRVALATVVGVRRSAPRPPGAKLAVNEHGEIAGSVSGGCVEGAVVEEQFELVQSLSGDSGLRGLLVGGPEIECSDLCLVRDVDTPADLEAARAEVGAQAGPRSAFAAAWTDD